MFLCSLIYIFCIETSDTFLVLKLCSQIIYIVRKIHVPFSILSIFRINGWGCRNIVTYLIHACISQLRRCYE